MAQVAVLSCPTLFVASWFGDSERALANMIASIANPIGMAVCKCPVCVHWCNIESDLVTFVFHLFSLSNQMKVLLVTYHCIADDVSLYEF